MTNVSTTVDERNALVFVFVFVFFFPFAPSSFSVSSSSSCMPPPSHASSDSYRLLSPKKKNSATAR